MPAERNGCEIVTDDQHRPFEHYLTIMRNNLASLRGPVKVTFVRHNSGVLVYDLEVDADDYLEFFS